MPIDIALVFATPTEWGAFKTAVQANKKWKKLPPDSYVTTFNTPAYFVSALGYKIAAVKANYQGQVHAACTAKNLIHQLQPRFIFSVGVAAGIPKKSSILDFLIPNSIHDLSLGKVTKKGQQRDGRPGLCDQDLVNHLAEFFTDISKYYDKRALKNVKLNRVNLAYDSEWKGPKVKQGVVFCDNAVRDDGFFSKANIIGETRKAVGGEMESFGFTEAIHCLASDNKVSRVPRFAMIKGVVDFGAKKSNEWQECVAPAVSNAIIDFIDHHPKDFHFVAEYPDQDRFKNAVNLALTNFKAHNSPAKKSLAFTLMNSTLEELDNINNDSYRVAIDLETNYLLRAKPIFQGANSLIATSIDSVSRFWKQAHTNGFAKDYLNAQVKSIGAEKIKRLFVFTTAEEAHKYSHILDAHHSAYGKVYVCSINTYKEIFTQFIEFESPNELLNIDYVLLGYPKVGSESARHDLRVLGDKFFTSASMNPQKLLELLGIKNFGVSQLEGVFESFAAIEKGVTDNTVMKGGTGHVLAWHPQMWKHREWPATLNLLFPQLEREVVHMEFLSVPAEISTAHLRRAFSEVKNSILKAKDQGVSLATKHNITDLWSGKRIRNTQPTADYAGRNASQLSPKNATEFVLYMKFKSQKDFEAFYREEEHQKIRAQFYNELSPHIAVLVENARNHSSSAFKLSTEAVIDSFASLYIEKVDFTDADEIDDIVQRTPYRWE